MIKNIEKRFVLFTMLVIGIILTFMTLIMTFHSGDHTFFHRGVATLLTILLLVLLGSILLSKIAMKPIRKAWQQQLDFTADASHELRTPIAVIRSNLEIIMDNGTETVEEQKKWLDNIHNETLRMGKLVEDLLTLSRADTGTQLMISEVALTDIIEERLHAFTPIATQHSIELSSELDNNLTLMGDSARLTQLLTILLDNAIKYTNQPGRITIAASKKKNTVSLTITDTGIGIPKKELKNIFLRFYRVEESRTHSIPGTGLGLPIAKWIVESHGGTILATSTVGEGTTFHITLPAVTL